jgi:hypothetical protein
LAEDGQQPLEGVAAQLVRLSGQPAVHLLRRQFFEPALAEVVDDMGSGQARSVLDRVSVASDQAMLQPSLERVCDRVAALSGGQAVLVVAYEGSQLRSGLALRFAADRPNPPLAVDPVAEGDPADPAPASFVPAQAPSP